jgi:hypothetical protein
MKSIYIIIPLLAFLFTGCEKDPETPTVFVLPGALNIATNSGDFIEFDITVISGDHPLSNFRVTQKPLNGLTSLTLDTIIDGQESNFFYIYEVPASEEDIILTFEATDGLGYVGETVRRLAIQENNFLPESTGHTLHSKYSTTGNNAFDLNESSPQFLATNPDSMLVDIMEFDPFDDNLMTGAWTSLSEVKFVRNNSFNYPEATQASAQNTFNSSTSVDLISDIEVDDILIIEYETETSLLSYAVIKITSILDENGSDDDRYVFNLKK